MNQLIGKKGLCWLLVPRVSVCGGFEFVVIQYIMAGHVAEEAAHLREAKKQREKQEGAGGSISTSRPRPSMPKFLPLWPMSVISQQCLRLETKPSAHGSLIRTAV